MKKKKKLKEGSKVKVKRISTDDAWYENRKYIVGKVGVLLNVWAELREGNWVSCKILFPLFIEQKNIEITFYKVVIKEVR